MTTDPQPDRCGYTWPGDHEIGDSPGRQSCCWRETAGESAERCPVHADAAETDPEAVVDSLEPPGPRPLLLDGADLSGLDVGSYTPFADGQFTVHIGRMDSSPAEVAETVDEDPSLENPFDGPDRLRERLEAGVEVTLSKRHPFGGVSLRESDLSEANFYGTRFGEADLRDADLSEGEFESADFSEACLVGADLSEATFRGADLSGATLVDADLSGAELKSVDLSEADLKYADLSDATLEGADLSGADLRDADLSKTYFGFTEVGGANLGFADLSDTTL